MKNYFFHTVLAIVGLVLLTSFVLKSRNYQTECISTDNDGYITIRIWDTKKGEKYSAENARKDAIHALLFSGVSGGSGCASQPPILNNGKEQESFKSIKNSFFRRSGKWSYFTRSAVSDDVLPNSLGDSKSKVYKVSVAKDRLRRYLEEKKIIKSLTNGF